MIECNDIEKLLEFCERDAVRCRHMAHELAPPCPEWDEAMRRTDYVDGKGCVLLDDPPESEPSERMLCFVDSLTELWLLACVRGGSLRVEGQVRNYAEFSDWCRALGPGAVETSEHTGMECLTQALGISGWRQTGADYTATAGTFRERATEPVRKSTPNDRPVWQRFVERHAHEPRVNARGGSQAVVRDFEFMCLGLPVDYYAICKGAEITGILTVNPFTNRCDEISTLFVDPQHRRQGLASSLLSAATRDILARGKLPAYSAGGNPVKRADLFGLLTGLGYYLVSVPWET